MIRFVYIGDQIRPGSKARDFAFWDTVHDKFVEFSGDTVFSSLADFREAGLGFSGRNVELYERCVGLLPHLGSSERPHEIEPDDAISSSPESEERN